MMMKSKQAWVNLIKIIIVIAAYWFIIRKIINAPDINLLPDIIKSIPALNFIILSAIIFLMLVNWSIESLKWIYILPNKIKVSFSTSFKAVLSGITAGTITPNRIGEFGGRILFLKTEHRKTGAAHTILADISQFVCTLFFGIIAFSITGYKILYKVDGLSNIAILTIVFGILLTIILLIIYFYPGVITGILNKINLFQKHIKDIRDIKDIRKLILVNTLLMSISRFIVFIIQFYLMFLFFGIDISFIHCFLAVSNLYLASSIIPNIPFGEPAIRSSFSVIFFSIYTDALAMVVIVSLSIYLINVAIPAIAGGYFLVKSKSSNYNENQNS